MALLSQAQRRKAVSQKAQHFADLFEASGEEYTCGAVVINFVRDHPEYDDDLHFPNRVWKVVQERYVNRQATKEARYRAPKLVQGEVA